jgi:uncharacterized glyoxalase superfamily protein PhnB
MLASSRSRGQTASLPVEERAMSARHTLIPCLRYADAPGAIDFLCRAFGFERQAVHTVPNDPAIVLHAQLVLGGNMVMLGSERLGRRDIYGWRTPGDAGCITTCIYAVVDDPDSHASRAEAEGATLITRPHDNEGYAGRGYDARDLEGNVWSFGNYDPWAQP